MSVMMLAIQQTQWGGLDKLHMVEVPRPTPLPTEILVRVKAAGVNPVDLYTREGKAYMDALQLPYIPGWDVSGVVEAVGYGVTRFKVGDEVFGMPWFPRQAGAYAEYVSAPARHFARKPSSVSHVSAAALPLAGLTAWQMLNDVAKVKPGDRVLINAGAGGVGHLAIQIARLKGAHVIATAQRAKHDFLRALGAEDVIDYTKVDPANHVHGADIAIELVGGDVCVRLLKCLRKGGILISAQAAWAPSLREEAAQLGVEATWFLVEPDGAGLEQLACLVKQRRVSVHVDRIFPMVDFRIAHEFVSQRRTAGKVVLTW
ncbi:MULTISPECIES: NADP-dependent oxidoreductase [unclassified Ensifer]|uniref:NADP-dependent oxidoreductase n=1 Tax=unclassified Ensifer TaxID=2633371 RepID=UPI001FCE038B|nr:MULTISPECIES: NADP-dependent oxidoreductase [unclassified Ensifer]